jgi:hypothetical protein
MALVKLLTISSNPSDRLDREERSSDRSSNPPAFEFELPATENRRIIICQGWQGQMKRPH